MAGKSPPRSGTKPEQSRDKRLKAALKANLGRRKAQARAKSAAHTGGNETPTGKEKG